VRRRQNDDREGLWSRTALAVTDIGAGGREAAVLAEHAGRVRPRRLGQRVAVGPRARAERRVGGPEPAQVVAGSADGRGGEASSGELQQHRCSCTGARPCSALSRGACNVGGGGEAAVPGRPISCTAGGTRRLRSSPRALQRGLRPLSRRACARCSRCSRPAPSSTQRARRVGRTAGSECRRRPPARPRRRLAPLSAAGELYRRLLRAIAARERGRSGSRPGPRRGLRRGWS